MQSPAPAPRTPIHSRPEFKGPQPTKGPAMVDGPTGGFVRQVIAGFDSADSPSEREEGLICRACVSLFLLMTDIYIYIDFYIYM